MVIRNRYGVRSKTWNRWSRVARAVFNETFGVCRDQEHINKAPRARQLPSADWDTIRWNAAFIAADAVRLFEAGNAGETT